MSGGRVPPGLPEASRRQLSALVDGLAGALTPGLRGVLLHGSAAMSGFDPVRSDLDLLVIAAGPLTPGQREALAACLLAVSGEPHPVELSVLAQADLAAWRHPCPHLFHFGEDQRRRFAGGDTAPQCATDPDVAAHVTVARARGIDLLGGYPPASLPEVPRGDFLAAVAADFAWARAAENLSGYRHANACRTWAYLCTGQVLSKSEGLQWCRSRELDLADIVEQVEARLRLELGGET